MFLISRVAVKGQYSPLEIRNLWKCWLHWASNLQGNTERITSLGLLYKFVCFQMHNKRLHQAWSPNIWVRNYLFLKNCYFRGEPFLTSHNALIYYQQLSIIIIIIIIIIIWSIYIRRTERFTWDYDNKRKTNKLGWVGKQKCLEEAFEYRQWDRLSQTRGELIP